MIHQDLNLNHLSQSQICYHYTMNHYSRNSKTRTHIFGVETQYSIQLNYIPIWVSSGLEPCSPQSQ